MRLQIRGTLLACDNRFDSFVADRCDGCIVDEPIGDEDIDLIPGSALEAFGFSAFRAVGDNDFLSGCTPDEIFVDHGFWVERSGKSGFNVETVDSQDAGLRIHDIHERRGQLSGKGFVAGIVFPSGAENFGLRFQMDECKGFRVVSDDGDRFVEEAFDDFECRCSCIDEHSLSREDEFGRFYRDGFFLISVFPSFGRETFEAFVSFAACASVFFDDQAFFGEGKKIAANGQFGNVHMSGDAFDCLFSRIEESEDFLASGPHVRQAVFHDAKSLFVCFFIIRNIFFLICILAHKKDLNNHINDLTFLNLG